MLRRAIPIHFLALLLLAPVATPVPINAQEPAAEPAREPERSGGIDEITVTARKREESIQDVPVAITAITGDLEHSAIRDLTDLNGYAPNVRIDEDSARSNARSPCHGCPNSWSGGCGSR